MVKLPENLKFKSVPRLAIYAVLAALATTALFAADGAYRGYRETSTQAAVPQSVATPQPAPVEARPAVAPSPGLPAEPEAARIETQAEDRLASDSIPNPDAFTKPTGDPVSDTANNSAPHNDAPRLVQPKPSKQPKQQARRLPAKPADRNRTTSVRPSQAEKPNVYWERDSQLGFAPQLTKRICDPATGHMPMQCYYPREGRQRFPARPLN